MSYSTSLLVGGLIPALAFGIGAIFQKHSNNIGIGQSNYLLYFSGGMILAALIAYFVFPENTASHKAGLFAVGHGLLFGVGFVFLAIGLTIYQVPISKLIPLANMSTLVAVILGLVVFGEYKNINISSLISGAALIVVGGVLVGRA